MTGRIRLVGGLALFSVASVASAQTLQFEYSRHQPAFPRGQVIAIESADVDGDGDLDLVGSVYRSQPVLLLNDGAGGFVDASFTHFPLQTVSALALDVADVDGDGDVDVVWGLDFGSYDQELYLNDGTGHLADATAARIPFTGVIEWTVAIKFADVDADGDPDILVGNARQRDKILINDGSGYFTDESNQRWPHATTKTEDFAVADFDGDGDLDFATAAKLQNRLLLNVGDGVFIESRGAIPTSGTSVAVQAADFDGDGDVDLYYGNVLSLYNPAPDSLMLNDGTGRFEDVSATHLPNASRPTLEVYAFDADGDGDQDVVGVGLDVVTLLLNDGTGHLVDASPARVKQDPSYETSVTAADLDGDGDQDLAMGCWDGIRILWNHARHTEAPDAPHTGQPYVLRWTHEPGYAALPTIALPMIAAAPGTTPVLPFGVLRLETSSLVLLQPQTLPQSVGVGTRTLTIPENPALGGLPLYFQTVIFDPLGPARFTNLWVDVISSP